MTDDAFTSAEIEARTASAQHVYDPRRLAIYDALVLGLFCRMVWRCPRSAMVDMYNSSVGANHLDVGPGTGYFLERCRFPVAEPKVALLDLSAECLAMSARRLARLHPTTHQANLLEPLPLETGRFDSVAMNLVLHTIPGGWKVKGRTFDNVARTLRPGGTLFGTTVLAEGVQMNRLTRWLLSEQHRHGNFQNQGDDPEGLREQLRRVFPESRVQIRGNVAMFWATAE